ncbi:MAG: ribosome assembly RNA-binding protein YhbY [Chloroflexaceae bacterium]
MQEITQTQRNYLRKLAHNLKPVVQVGRQGLSDLVIAKVNQELAAHELIKVKFVDFQDQKHELTDELVAQSDSTLVRLIGNVAILYRQHPEADKREIILPAGG